MVEPRHSLRTGVSVIVALLLFALVLTVGADAHIGASHSPFTTEAPDLRTVAVDGDAFDFCFDEEVAAAPGTFLLVGYDSETVALSDQADLDDTLECVEVEFDGDMDGLEFTVGAVDTGAVEDREGNESVRASASLTGNQLNDGGGRTLGPKLVDFEADENNDEITYTFDRAIGNCANVLGSPTDFGYYQQPGENGGRVDGNTVQDCDDGDDEVTVFFTGIGVDDVVSVFVQDSTVCTGPADLGGSHCNGFESEGDSTDSPDLDSAERTDTDEITYTFDEDVNLNTDDAFWVYVEDSTGFDVVGPAICDEEDDDVIACEFPEIDEAADAEVMFAGVNDGAVDAQAAPNESNTIGDTPVGELVLTPGTTDSPDLETCSVDDNIVTFNFDETFFENSVNDPTQWLVFDAEGNESPSQDLETSDDNKSVDAEFDEDAIADAVGCLIDSGAQHDFLLNDNAIASAGFGGVQPTPTGSGTSSPGPGPGPGPAPGCQAGDICGTTGDDVLTGTPGDDVIIGGDGNDTIDGGGGSDTIEGGPGDDSLEGGPGEDTINGGDGNDNIVGGDEGDTLNGNDGNDRIVGDGGTAAGPSAGVHAAQSGQGGPDKINGGGGNDKVVAGVGNDDVIGGGGTDQITTNAGADDTHAGKGSDAVRAGGGNDKVFGEAGNDDMAGEGGNDILKGGGGVNDFNGGSGKDTCVLDNRKDDTKSCEKKKLNFKLNFFPYKLPL